MPEYTTKQDFPAITFSHPARGIYFLTRIYVVHNYTQIKGLHSGKITSLPNSENVINLHASFSVIAEHILHAHHETHLQ